MAHGVDKRKLNNNVCTIHVEESCSQSVMLR